MVVMLNRVVLSYTNIIVTKVILYQTKMGHKLNNGWMFIECSGANVQRIVKGLLFVMQDLIT